MPSETGFREFAHRVDGGVDHVTLRWSPRDNPIAVSVSDSRSAESESARTDEVVRPPFGADIGPAARPTDRARGKVRSTLGSAEERRSMTAPCGSDPRDGTTWQPWMDMTFTRRD